MLLPIEERITALLRRVEMLDPSLARDIHQAVAEYAQTRVDERLWAEAVETDELATSD
jgi:hypothetical protein